MKRKRKLRKNIYLFREHPDKWREEYTGVLWALEGWWWCLASSNILRKVGSGVNKALSGRCCLVSPPGFTMPCLSPPGLSVTPVTVQIP